MKRVIWIAIIFGGGVIALMVASLVLVQQSIQLGPAANPRAALMQVPKALQAWNYEELRKVTTGIDREEFRELFDGAHSEAPLRRSRWQTWQNLVQTFPSIRFKQDVKPMALHLMYMMGDNAATCYLDCGFRRKNDAWFIDQMRWQVPEGREPVTFTEGQAPPIRETLDKLFLSLVKDQAAFKAVFQVPSGEPTGMVLDGIRRDVMRCGNDRLMRLLPDVGPLPKGTTRVQMTVGGDVQGRPTKMQIDLLLGKTPRFAHFSCDTLQPQKPSSEKKTPAEGRKEAPPAQGGAKAKSPPPTEPAPGKSPTPGGN